MTSQLRNELGRYNRIQANKAYGDEIVFNVSIS